MLDSKVKTALKGLVADMKEDEDAFVQKDGNDLFAKGQLSATQHNRVKLELILESFGSSRTSTINIEN